MTHCELGGGQGNIFFVKMIYNVVGLKEGRISFFLCVFVSTRKIKPAEVWRDERNAI